MHKKKFGIIQLLKVFLLLSLMIITLLLDIGTTKESFLYFFNFLSFTALFYTFVREYVPRFFFAFILGLIIDVWNLTFLGLSSFILLLVEFIFQALENNFSSTSYFIYLKFLLVYMFVCLLIYKFDLNLVANCMLGSMFLIPYVFLKNKIF